MLLRTLTTLRAPVLSAIPRTAAPAAAVAARSFHSTPPRQGLTNIFEASDSPPLSITKLTTGGFQLSDGLLVQGGCIFADGRALLWDVDPPKGNGSDGLDKAWEGWSEERFKVFETLVPRPGEFGV